MGDEVLPPGLRRVMDWVLRAGRRVYRDSSAAARWKHSCASLSSVMPMWRTGSDIGGLLIHGEGKAAGAAASSGRERPVKAGLKLTKRRSPIP